MTSPDRLDGTVTYTVKELLERIEKQLHAMDGKLDTKADASTVAELGHRMTFAVEALAGRVDALEQANTARETAARVHGQRDTQMFTRRQKLWGAVGAVVTLVALFLGPLLPTLLGH